jgi:Tol biopolymer transport system component
LLKAGTQPALVWDTETGAAILSSLAWSKDGSMLAFVADPQGIGQTTLYIYSTATGEVHPVPVPLKGSASHPTWSPDGIRIAFKLAHGGDVDILDYNTQNHGILIIPSAVNTKVNPTDDIMTLDWSPDGNAPAITWSVGKEGQIHSIWQRHIGSNDVAQVQELAQGNYSQAVYSQAGYGGKGAWLLVSSLVGHRGDIESLDLTGSVIRLASKKQASFVQWSPDGMHASYLDAISSGTGTLHDIDIATGADTVLATGVANDPPAAWSADSQYIVYSNSTHTFIVYVPKAKATQLSRLQGSPSAFTWCATQTHQLIVALADGQPGIYLVDPQHATVVKLDKEGTHGPLLWTQIP